MLAPPKLGLAIDLRNATRRCAPTEVGLAIDLRNATRCCAPHRSGACNRPRQRYGLPRAPPKWGLRSISATLRVAARPTEGGACDRSPQRYALLRAPPKAGLAIDLRNVTRA